MRQKSEIKEKPARQSAAVILKNSFFALGVIHRAAPGFLLVSGVCNALNGFRSALTNVLLLQYVVNSVQTGESFYTIGGVILACLAAQCVLNVVINCFSPWSNVNVYVAKNRLKIQRYVDKMLFEKARALDLEAYENPEEYDRYFKARDESLSHIMSVYYCFLQFAFRSTDISTSAAVLIGIDPLLAVFLILPAVSSVFYKRANDLNYESDLIKKKHRRSRDYALRSFYLADFAKEMRTGDFPSLMLARFRREAAAQDGVIRDYAPRLIALNYIAILLQEILLPLGAMAYAVWQALITGSILYGDCLVVINSISGVSWGIIALFQSVTDVMKQSRYIGNIRDFLDAKIRIADKPDAAPVRRGDLEFRNVTFTYHGADRPTLKNLSFKIADGEKVALVGQNGSGKTTIAKLMLRLYDVTEGEILYGGVNIKNLRLDEYRNAFAVVFQDFKNFAASAGENVLLHPMRTEDEPLVRTAMEKAGVAERIDRLPEGIHTRLTREFDETGVNLSGGESQKLSIARIYAKEASIAILDEPSSALDPIAEYKMYENMMDACRTRSVVFISHRLSSAVLADRVILLEHGQITEEGTHQALMERGGKYADMFRMQAEKYRESEGTENG